MGSIHGCTRIFDERLLARWGEVEVQPRSHLCFWKPLGQELDADHVHICDVFFDYSWRLVVDNHPERDVV